MELATGHGDEQFLGLYLLRVKLDSSMENRGAKFCRSNLHAMGKV